MNDDATLLREYLERGDELAFTALVQRHVGLVYSVALRRVGGDAHLAEDVAQKVFIDFARKAESLKNHTTLSGWLYTSAHHGSAAVVRAERRRKAREAAAHCMQTLRSDADPDAEGVRLRALIDDVIIALKNGEREAIALRYFEQRSFAEVGSALRITEEAARKRVDRALSRIRVLLTQRGVTSTTAALGLALASIGTATPPEGLTAKLASHALSSASASTPFLGGLINALWPAAAVLTLGTLAIGGQSHSNDALRQELTRLTQTNVALAALRTENANLARALASPSEASTPQPLALAPAPTTSLAVASRPIAAEISVSPAGTIAWNGDFLSLSEFINRLRVVPGTIDPNARIHIRAVGAEFLALAYVIDEVRKVQLNHVTVESAATPDPRAPGQWF